MAHKYRTIASFPSKSKPGKKYLVKQDETGALSCNCPTWVFMQWGRRDCPHVRIVRTECKSVLKNPEPIKIESIKVRVSSYGSNSFILEPIKTLLPKDLILLKQYLELEGKYRKVEIRESKPGEGAYIFITEPVGFRYPGAGRAAVRLNLKLLVDNYNREFTKKNPKNPEPKWVCPNCGAVIWTPMPQAMLKCPVCGKKTKLGETKTNPTRLYEKFHGTSPRRLRKVSFRNPKPGEKVVKVGRLVELVYHPEPPSKRSGSQYIHSFGDYGFKFKNVQPVLAVSNDGKQLYIINDKASPKFGEKGIVG